MHSLLCKQPAARPKISSAPVTGERFLYRAFALSRRLDSSFYCDSAITTMRQCDGDSTIRLSHSGHCIIALSHCRTIAIAQPHCRHRIVVIALSSSHCRHRTIAPSPSHYHTIALPLSELSRITTMALTVFRILSLLFVASALQVKQGLPMRRNHGRNRTPLSHSFVRTR